VVSTAVAVIFAALSGLPPSGGAALAGRAAVKVRQKSEQDNRVQAFA
jgi:hypothetical protein